MLDLNPAQTAKYTEYLHLLEDNEWFICVSTLSSGASFGELALINDAKRMATIKCISDCQFATIEKNEYQRVLRKLELKQFN